MISVLAALVLGLLTASVKNAFDATDSQIRQSCRLTRSQKSTASEGSKPGFAISAGWTWTRLRPPGGPVSGHRGGYLAPFGR